MRSHQRFRLTTRGRYSSSRAFAFDCCDDNFFASLFFHHLPIDLDPINSFTHRTLFFCALHFDGTSCQLFGCHFSGSLTCVSLVDLLQVEFRTYRTTTVGSNVPIISFVFPPMTPSRVNFFILDS